MALRDDIRLVFSVLEKLNFNQLVANVLYRDNQLCGWQLIAWENGWTPPSNLCPAKRHAVEYEVRQMVNDGSLIITADWKLRLNTPG